MSSCRRTVGVLVALALVLALSPLPSQGLAGSLDACAQRVIRDWYSGGRVDDVYPLACYGAAIRALPDDVLQYSNADQDIRRALAFARQGRQDPGNGPPAGAAKPAPPEAASEQEPPSAAPAPDSDTSARPESTKPPEPVAREAAPTPREAPLVAEAPARTSSVPYPILGLAALAGVLLTAGAIGWLTSRRG